MWNFPNILTSVSIINVGVIIAHNLGKINYHKHL